MVRQDNPSVGLSGCREQVKTCTHCNGTGAAVVKTPRFPHGYQIPCICQALDTPTKAGK